MVAPDESLETADLSKRHGKHHSNPTGPAINVFQNGVTTTTVGTIQQRNQGSHYARYDPARSPPPSLSSSSSSSIPKSPHMVTSTHLQYGSALPPSSLTSPSLTQASSFNNNNRKESSHSIHNLLTSSVEPVSHSPKKSEPTFVTPVTTSTYSGRSSSSTRPYNLSSLLHDNTQQKEANDVGYRSKEVHHPRIQPPPQQQHRQQQPYQQMPLERSQAANIPNSSSARTPPVQFINFHADRPRAQNSPTTQQKTIFIQGEYHNNASDPPTKSRSASIVRSNTPPQHHQWQQPSGPETISPQTTTSSTIKRSNHRPSQTSSSTTSSPSSSPRDSRRSGSYNVWRATGQQQQPTPNYGVGTNHPAQAHYYHSQQQHQYQQQQQYYDGSNNSDQHATLGGVHPHHHLHQQSIRPVTESTEYHCDPSTPSQHHHPPYQDMYRPPQYHGQSTLTTTVSSSSLPPPEKKSDKAKLDFILN
ncbi:hypothetical protein BC941DRAFT_453582 [Chlamydoabsidia padenii]|nr:hypothetical protein BC941DRAFT_453582 [Chlamydoabsidia padenii]